MTRTKNDSISDPLFQLNVLLWLAQPLPDDGVITPVLYRRGFSVYAISPALVVPLDLQVAALGASVAVQASGRPDVLLAQETERKFSFTECKASSFGPDSTTAGQARSFLLMAGERTPEVLGLDRTQVNGTLVSYLVPESQRADLNNTMTTLRADLSSKKLPTGDFTIVGLQATDDQLNILFDANGSSFFGFSLAAHTIMPLQPETDPRPLYFIPYDPDVYASEEERVFCKRVLFERLHSAVLVAIGRTDPPAELILTPNDLLNDAMFGMYALWVNRESARHMRGLCRQLLQALARAVNGEVTDTFTYDQAGWRVHLSDGDKHKRVIDAVARFSCITMDLRAEPQRGLFDE